MTSQSDTLNGISPLAPCHHMQDKQRVAETTCNHMQSNHSKHTDTSKVVQTANIDQPTYTPLASARISPHNGLYKGRHSSDTSCVWITTIRPLISHPSGLSCLYKQPAGNHMQRTLSDTLNGQSAGSPACMAGLIPASRTTCFSTCL